MTEKKTSQLDEDILQGRADVLRARKAANVAEPAAPPDSARKTETVDVRPVRAVKVEPDHASQNGQNGNTNSGDSSAHAIPHLNLAEKILVEQRQAASLRRTKSTPSSTDGGRYQPHDTVGDIVRQSRQKRGFSDPDASPPPAHQPIDRAAFAPDAMTDSQRRLLADIVTRDIAAFFQ